MLLFGDWKQQNSPKCLFKMHWAGTTNENHEMDEKHIKKPKYI